MAESEGEPVPQVIKGIPWLEHVEQLTQVLVEVEPMPVEYEPAVQEVHVVEPATEA